MNSSGQAAVDYIETALGSSLNKLQQKMNQTEKSIEQLHTKVSTLFILLNRPKNMFQVFLKCQIM